MHFDEFAKKRNLNVNNLKVSDHCIKRARERLNWKNLNDTHILGNLRAMLRKSIYIGKIVTEEERKISYMFANDRRAIYLSENLEFIVTVIVHDVVTYAPLKDELLKSHQKEMRKITRKEKAKLKKLDDLKHDCAIEVAILKRRLKRTRSENVKQVCKTRIKAINKTIEDYENEIKQIQNEKRHIARSMVSIV